MNENTPAGGAGPAIAAHSKDGSEPRHMSNSNGSANKRDHSGFPENLSELSEKAGEGVERVKASVREATENAREALSGSAREALAEGGRVADQAVDLVRGQPVVAMAITGAICLAFGILLGRR